MLAVVFLALALVACGREAGPPDPTADSEQVSSAVESSETPEPNPSGPCTTRPAADAPLLLPDRPTFVTVALDSPTRLLLDIEAGSFVRVEASQEVVDVQLHLCSPEGTQVEERDSAWPEDSGIAEILSALPEQGGRYWLLLQTGNEGGEVGVQATVRQRKGNDPDRVRAEKLRFENLVDIFTGKQTPETAIHLQEAAHLWHGLGEAREEAEALHWGGSAYFRLGRWQEALPFFERALPLWRETGIRQREAESHDFLGKCYEAAQDSPKARRHFQQAVETWRSLGVSKEEARAASILGHFLYSEGDYFDARPHYERAVELRRDLVAASPDHKEPSQALRDSLTGLGSTLSELGELRLSLERHREALAIAEKIGDVTPAVLNNLAGAYGAVGDYELAERYYDRALETLDETLAHLERDTPKRSETLKNRATTLSNRAWALTGQERFEEALQDFQTALALTRELEDRRLEAIILGHLGRTYSDLGRVDEGRPFLEQALQLRESLEDTHSLGPTLRDLGELERRAGNSRVAREYLERALGLADSYRSPTRRSRVLIQLALIDSAEGDFPTAFERSRQALELTQWLEARVPRRDFRQTFTASKHYMYEHRIGLWMDAPGAEEDRLRAGFELSDGFRARGLLGVLREAGVDLYRDAPADLVQRESELRQRLRSNPPDDDSSSVDVDLLVDELRQVQERLREHSPAYAALDPAEPATLEEIQRFLSPEDTLVEYLLGFERSFAWAVTRTSIHAVELPPRREIEPLVRDLHGALEIADERAIELAADLARRVVLPLVPFLQGKRLIVVPDGALHYVPFAPLPLSDDGSDVLLDRYEIFYGASAGFLAQLQQGRSRPRERTKIAAVLADPVFSARDSRLSTQGAAGSSRLNPPPKISAPISPLTDSRGRRLRRLRRSAREAEILERLAGRDRVFVALGTEASRDTLLRLDLSDYRILHLATHGEADDAHPELSRLTFSLYDGNGEEIPGDVLLSDIFDLRLQTDLVVLSACQTALGRDIRGEGLVGLTRGFFHAGSQQVMASLWRVTDTATAFLMEAFYENLLVHSMSAPKALRQAQLTLRQRKGFEHPAFWAGFVVQGTPPP